MILLKRGTRIALRNKVNDSLITGIRLVDSCLPIGRGQRQLILGDKSTGKTSIFVFSLLTSWRYSIISSFEGVSTKRLFGLYLGININLSKLMKLLHSIISYSSFSTSPYDTLLSSDSSASSNLSVTNYSSVLFLVISTHSSSSALLSFMIVNLGITICERLRDRSFDSLICFDDLSKHAKCYRQVSLLLGRVPSRDAYSSDVFNIHSSLLERSGRLRLNYFGSSITSFPVIETINSDITEFIATNVISITDGQLYMNKRLFLDSIRPAIDSALSVSRIGSNAQCKFVKVVSAGLKNELTSLRIAFSSFGSQSAGSFLKLSSLNSLFSQSHLIPSFIE
jgi:F-type H+-transporting ATPase subunit alpha